MEKIVEYKVPLIQWSLYDEDNLHEIEERLFNVSYHPTDDLGKLVNYRAQRNIAKSQALKWLPKEHRTRAVIRLKDDEVALHQRLKRRTIFKTFHEHSKCYGADSAMQIPRNSDMATNLCFEYLKRHPSPIFSALLHPPKCNMNVYPNLINIPFYKPLIETLKLFQSELENKTFSMLDFDFGYILKTKRFYKFCCHMTDTAYIKFIVLILLQLNDLNTWFGHLITILDRIQRCFDGNPVKICPGIIVCAPPGTGKSHFVDSTGHFMLDTDSFLHHTLDKRPEIIRDLVNSGFSVITNRWEYEKFSEWAVSVIISFDQVRRITSYNKQGIFHALENLESDRRKRLEQISFKYTRRRICPIPISEWETNLERGLKILPFILLKSEQSLADGMVKLYRAITV